MKKAEKLINDIEKLKWSWNEKSMFKIKNVKNLSMSDLETLELYVSMIINNGSYNNLMQPMGDIKKVLELYGI